MVIRDVYYNNNYVKYVKHSCTVTRHTIIIIRQDFNSPSSHGKEKKEL